MCVWNRAVILLQGWGMIMIKDQKRPPLRHLSSVAAQHNAHGREGDRKHRQGRHMLRSKPEPRGPGREHSNRRIQTA